ncbi:unnamed protein product [Clonostachys chloroleuca]|uniref:Uncharacterized protein n=1 Tax=Clonostachys chloroleuca TaxID=1926264 RepID=A0AA35M688_9HYPO|nr:unnamed protein product [Clonostachys chloroleuca]
MGRASVHASVSNRKGRCEIGSPAYALAIDCNGNFTITKESDAKDLRENCKIVGGDLIFGGDISENINLDGVEEVRGDWKHNPLSD